MELDSLFSFANYLRIKCGMQAESGFSTNFLAVLTDASFKRISVARLPLYNAYPKKFNKIKSLLSTLINYNYRIVNSVSWNNLTLKINSCMEFYFSLGFFYIYDAEENDE